MTTDEDNINPVKKRSSLYTILTYLSLLFLAIFWSVDSSFIYLFTGCAIFFFFLSFKNGIGIKKESDKYDYADFEEVKNKNSTADNITDDLKSVLTDKGISFESNQTIQGGQSGKRIILFIAAGAFVFFFAFVFIAIESVVGDESDEFYYQQGETFYDEAQYDSAYIYFKKAVRVNDESAEALTGLGNVFMIRE